MKYIEMIECARKDGVASESKMWQSIESIEHLLEEIEDDGIKMRFMRKQHEIMYGEHYNEQMARIDVESLYYTDRDGVETHGQKWSANEVEVAMRNMPVKGGVTKWDKYVAANVMYSDLCAILTDEEILKAAHAFFLNDQDWPQKESKIWDYMSAKAWYETRVD